MKMLVAILFLLVCWADSVLCQIAKNYPNDVNIETDPNVLFVEKFDDGLSNIFSRYDELVNTNGMVLATDVPPGSLSGTAIKMTSKKGENSGGHLYKSFSPGFDGTVYVRYYVKYPKTSEGYFHHESVWFGGYNPGITYPYPRAGTCGLGNSRIGISYEPVWKGSKTGMDAYLYWGDMKSYNDGANCFGNVIVNQGSTDYGVPLDITTTAVNFDQWMCVEIMIKLNNPVTAYNGELAIWHDGVQIGHWGPGFPKGHWLKDRWYNNPADPPFEGFRWRTTENLKINWVWFEFYHDDANAPSSNIMFDHLVMAKEYIGPIENQSMGIDQNSNNELSCQIFPNPTTGTFSMKVNGLNKMAKIEIYNSMGEIFLEKEVDPTNGTFLNTIELGKASKGVYHVKITSDQQSVYKSIVLR